MSGGHWIAPLAALLERGSAVVRVTVAAVRGSAPREPGATLLLWLDRDGQAQSHGTIGGGHLELRAMQIARGLLDAAVARRRAERFTLGAALGQCCGGAVELFWERFDDAAQLRWADSLDLAAGAWRWTPVDADAASDCDVRASAPLPPTAEAGFITDAGRRWFVERLQDRRTPLYLYGGGHVGRALVHVLQGLPFRVRWIDSRDGMDAAVEQADAPQSLAARAPGHAWHLVMTHSHDEDFAICDALLADGRFGFLGVIGSATKGARFRSRLLARGHAPQAVERLHCPIGLAGLASKLPSAIAVAVAADLLQRQAAAGTDTFIEGARYA